MNWGGGESHSISLIIWETENCESHNFKLVMVIKFSKNTYWEASVCWGQWYITQMPKNKHNRSPTLKKNQTNTKLTIIEKITIQEL